LANPKTEPHVEELLIVNSAVEHTNVKIFVVPFKEMLKLANVDVNHAANVEEL
jgi:hypothetical protein